MVNKINYNKEERALERTLSIIRKCLQSTYPLCTPYHSLDYITTNYCELIKKLWFYKGSRSAVNRLKEYNRIAKLSLQYSNIPEELRVEWCRCDRRGLPNDISFIKPWLTSTKLSDKRFALDVLNTYRLFYLPPDTSTISITEKCTGDLHDRPEWRNFLTFWVKKLPQFRTGFSEKLLGWGSTKSGPNGPALMSSHLDSTSMIGDKELCGSYNAWLKVTNQMELLQHCNAVKDPEASLLLKQGLRHSKLSFLSEGGGKTRVIAIADYWTQISLHGLHKWAMNCLRRLTETDCTYDHEKGVSLLKDITKSRSKPIFSLDLKSATDRFPVFLQEDLLCAKFGPEFAKSWKDLMVKRDFVVNKDDKVRYGCGQPMGLLSSWAIFSLTHHAIIEYAAFKESIPAFRDYYMLGDDVVIYNTQVASRYIKIMKEVGVEISIPKSFIVKDKSSNHISEFAKRIMVNGEDLSPIPAKLTKEVQRDIFMFPEFIRKLRALGRGLTPVRETLVCNGIYGTIPKSIALVMTAPKMITGMEPWDINILRKHYQYKSSESAPIEGFTFSAQYASEVVMRAWLEVRIEHLIKTQESQVNFFMKTMEAPEGLITDLLKKFPRRGIPISRSVIKRDSYNPLELHPLVNKVQHLHWTFWSVEEELRTLLNNVPELSGVALSEFKIPEFMPQVEYRPFLGYRREEARTRLTLVRRLHASLVNKVD